MQKKNIHLTIGALATVCALPLAFMGLRGLWGVNSPPVPSKGEQAASTARPTQGSLDESVEIQMVSGTGADINRALKRLPARGGKVLLAPGVFETREPIVMDRDNVELRGSGSLTIIRLAENADCPVVIIGPTVTPVTKSVTNVRLKSLVIDGNRTNQSQEKDCWGDILNDGGVSYIRNNALTIRGATEAKVEEVVARNARCGGVVLEKGCRQIYIDNLEATDNQFDGLACYETEDSYFSRLKLHGNQAAGISLDADFNHNVLKSAVIRGNGSQGIFMRDSNHNDFKKLEISENGAQGIFIAQADDLADTRCTNNVFSDITVMDNRGSGLRVNNDSCIENMVRNSRFKGNQPGNVSESKASLVSLLKVENF